MCSRYTITAPPEAVRQWFQIQSEVPNWPPRYNAAPTNMLPIARNSDGGNIGTTQHARVYRCGTSLDMTALTTPATVRYRFMYKGSKGNGGDLRLC
jgi:putative SOS response-associated peptidase YedK